jgi:hypothetical protein
MCYAQPRHSIDSEFLQVGLFFSGKGELQLSLPYLGLWKLIIRRTQLRAAAARWSRSLIKSVILVGVVGQCRWGPMKEATLASDTKGCPVEDLLISWAWVVEE